MTRKELKAFFNAVETGTKDVYRLYDKSDMSKRTLGRFIGEVSYNSRNKNAIFEYCVYNDCEVLKKACLEWANSLPFSSDCYDGSYRLHYRLKMVVSEYLERLRFVYDNNNEEYRLNLSALGQLPTIRVTINEERGATNLEDKIEIQYILSNEHWVTEICYTVNEIVNTINSVMAMTYAYAMPILIEASNNINIDSIEHAAAMQISTLNRERFEVEKTPLKDTLIPKLEEALRILKNE